MSNLSVILKPLRLKDLPKQFDLTQNTSTTYVGADGNLPAPNKIVNP
jgi:hypothetical protein